MCTLFQNIVQICRRQLGNIIQPHLLQTLQYGFAYAFDGEQGLGLCFGKGHESSLTVGVSDGLRRHEVSEAV